MTEYAPLIPEIAPTPFNISEEVQKAVNAALNSIEGRSFADRRPELGKMINCRVCGRRHRTVDSTYNRKKKSGIKIVGNVLGKCEQVFTYRTGDYELYRKNEKGELVPDYRTAIRPEEKQTRNQLHGSPRASNFSKPRFNPHPSKIKLLFVQRVREVFVKLGFALEKTEDQSKQEFQEQFQKDLQRARVVAARQIRKERRASNRATRRIRNESLRINRGL